MLSYQELMNASECQVIPAPKRNTTAWNKAADYYVSEKFQWLPSEVYVTPEGSSTFTSYINNLHPAHFGDLYDSCRVFNHFVQHCPHRGRKTSDREAPITRRSSRISGEFPYIPSTTCSNGSCLLKKNVDLRGRQLQVIVKATNIHLTPEMPEYSGGAWHVEGMRNESIVATPLLLRHREYHRV